MHHVRHRRERRQGLGQYHRAAAGAAAAVRRGKGLVQVEVRDVGAEPTRAGETDHGVEVGAVEVDLPAELVDQVADLDDPGFEDAMGRRVGDHQRRQGVLVVGDLLLEVVEVDVAGRVALHHRHLHPGHDGAGGVGPVCRGRDQADDAAAVATGVMPGADGEESGQLALRSGIGLEGHCVIAGDLAEHPLEVVDELVVAGHLFDRGVRVECGRTRAR